MYTKRAIEVYQATAVTTTPMIDTMIELLNEMSNVLADAESEVERQTDPDISEPMKKLQYALFELMAVIDHGTEEGERLFLLYIALNQALVTVQLHRSYDLLPDIQLKVKQLSEAWTAARRNQRLQRIQSDKL
ncbi:hypothetical protein SporoP37_13105 [Sporosarcina sp. P37]|uniref:flagellar protein FliS n=1 Tax=unclassified Sporosarcina TaxID=2647733 RepID=UPI000A17A71F|nr:MULTISPECIES: flagellar protein FliS [unclassified Sporosarcina]ARK25503.1 hypothetical protein SporoP37_13105 [Sporosarcina sp. P37]PID17966.1 hypothetical protein CSV62_10715 [Sporosarcina sp. P35]